MQKPSGADNTLPWYRQGWPWLLIAIPASAVIGGIITLALAIQSPNALVVDDYYKEGLAINQKMHRLATAENMGLRGLLRSDGKQLTLHLDSGTPVGDRTLTLRLVHATRAELDRQLELRQVDDGSYITELDRLVPGTWYLFLQPGNNAWEIRARMAIDGAFQAYLTSKG
ncbi:MAG: FixH family protein [Thiogranum sp.]|nr:FixH family protein [Thiogranum sp.]